MVFFSWRDRTGNGSLFRVPKVIHYGYDFRLRGSFAAERNHRIDSGGAPRREVACQQCDREQRYSIPSMASTRMTLVTNSGYDSTTSWEKLPSAIASISFSKRRSAER